MSTRSLNWLKLGATVAMAFVFGLFVAGLLHFPPSSLAQGTARNRPALVPVSAPRLPATKTLDDVSDAFASVVEAVRPSVVYVEVDRPASDDETQSLQQLLPRLQRQVPQHPQVPQPMDHSSGSGFIVSSDGYILTNNHVIEGGTRVKVHLLDGRSYLARIVGSDKDTDVGVLKIDATGLTPAALGESDNVKVGEWVLAIGNPLGSGLTFSVTSGIVSAKGRACFDLGATNCGNQQITDFIQTDAVINRGNSGGPLINVRGEVVGINAAIASYTGAYEGYAFAVPIDLARNVMQQIIEHGRVERTGLGIQVNDADADDAQYLGLDSIGGVRVGTFPQGIDSPAKRAGIEVGDVIIAVDGHPVKYTAQLQQAVGFRNAGDPVKITVARKDGRHEFTVRLMRYPNPDDSAAAPTTTGSTAGKENSGNALGLTVEPLTPALAAQAYLPAATKGLLVRSITQGTPAEEKLCALNGCPYRAPDVITEVEGKAVRSEAELKDALGAARHGVVTLTVVSGDNQREATERIVRLRVGGN